MKLKMPMMRMPRRPKAARPPKAKLNAVVRASTRAAREEDFDDEEYESEPNMKLSHAFMVVLVLHVMAVGGVFAFNSIKAKQNGEAPSKAAKTTESSSAVVANDEPVASKAVEKKAAPAASTTAAKSTTAKTDGVHEVAAGETLGKIASAYGISVEALEKENGLAALSTIKPGQRLKIPHASSKPVAETKKTAPAPATTTAAKTTAAAPTAEKAATPAAAVKPTTPATTKPANTAGTYVVAKGDNPNSIAKKMKVSVAQLLKANNIDDPTKLQIGQKLVIPKSN